VAVIETHEINPKVPRLEDIDGDKIRLDYDPLADSLWVSLTGDARPIVNVYSETDDDLMYLVDPYTQEVVGLEIERFLDRLLRVPQVTEEADSSGHRR
jgi:hypothetical protein